MKSRKRLYAIALAASVTTLVLISAFLLSHPSGHPSSSTTTPGQVVATYVTSSAPNSSQWLVVKSSTLPISVFANNTGEIQEYSTLASLNQTRIGVFCDSVSSSGECLSFKSYFETGWFWDSSNQILYIHYVGDRFVKLSVRAS